MLMTRSEYDYGYAIEKAFKTGYTCGVMHNSFRRGGEEPERSWKRYEAGLVPPSPFGTFWAGPYAEVV